MRVGLSRVAYGYLESEINHIGYENILNIIPTYSNKTGYSVFVIIYKR